MLDLRNFVGVNCYARRLQLYDQVIDFIRAVPSEGPLQHQIHDASLFADMLYRLIDYEVIPEQLAVLAQYLGQALIVDGQVELFAENPGVVGDDFVKLRPFLKPGFHLRGKKNLLKAIEEFKPVGHDFGSANDRRQGSLAQQPCQLLLLSLRQLDNLAQDK